MFSNFTIHELLTVTKQFTIQFKRVNKIKPELRIDEKQV